MCALKETLISCSKAKISENQTQNLILQLVRLQYKSNSPPHKISTFKVRALIRKGGDPESWNGDVLEDLTKQRTLSP